MVPAMTLSLTSSLWGRMTCLTSATIAERPMDSSMRVIDVSTPCAILAVIRKELRSAPNAEWGRSDPYISDLNAATEIQVISRYHLTELHMLDSLCNLISVSKDMSPHHRNVTREMVPAIVHEHQGENTRWVRRQP